MAVVDPMGPVMSLPTDPFAAPSSGPLALGPALAEDRAEERAALRWPPPTWRALAVATGTLAVGAAAVGASLGVGGPPDPASSSLAPAAGAAATLAPPAVGAPIVPRNPTPPWVTTRPTPAADSEPTAPVTRRSTVTTRAVPDREQEVREAVAAMRARAVEAREQAWERAVERALAARAAGGRAHGHGGGHHR